MGRRRRACRKRLPPTPHGEENAQPDISQRPQGLRMPVTGSAFGPEVFGGPGAMLRRPSIRAAVPAVAQAAQEPGGESVGTTIGSTWCCWSCEDIAVTRRPSSTAIRRAASRPTTWPSGTGFAWPSGSVSACFISWASRCSARVDGSGCRCRVREVALKGPPVIVRRTLISCGDEGVHHGAVAFAGVPARLHEGPSDGADGWGIPLRRGFHREVRPQQESRRGLR